MGSGDVLEMDFREGFLAVLDFSVLTVYYLVSNSDIDVVKTVIGIHHFKGGYQQKTPFCAAQHTVIYGDFLKKKFVVRLV